jgi:hypothetical protein
VALCSGHHFARGGTLLGGTLLGVALCSVWHFAWGVTLLGVALLKVHFARGGTLFDRGGTLLAVALLLGALDWLQGIRRTS